MLRTFQFVLSIALVMRLYGCSLIGYRLCFFPFPVNHEACHWEAAQKRECEGKRVYLHILFYIMLLMMLLYEFCRARSISLSSLRNCLSVSARFATVLHACRTVAWSLLPTYCPIFAVDRSRYFFARNIAT